MLYSKLKFIPFVTSFLYAFLSIMDLLTVGFVYTTSTPFRERALEMFNWNARAFIMNSAIAWILCIITINVAMGFIMTSIMAKNKRKQVKWDIVAVALLIVAFIVQMAMSINYMYSALNDARKINDNPTLTMAQMFDQGQLALWFLIMIIPFAVTVPAVILTDRLVFKKVFKREPIEQEITGVDRLRYKGVLLAMFLSFDIVALFSAFMCFAQLLSQVLALSDWKWENVNDTGFLYTTAGYAVYVIMFICIGIEFLALFAEPLFMRIKEPSKKVALTFTVLFFILSMLGGVYILIWYIKKYVLGKEEPKRITGPDPKTNKVETKKVLVAA